jgi:hypothetical protein
MATRFDGHQNQFFEINIELKPGIIGTEKTKELCNKIIVNRLLAKNAEYSNNFHAIPHKVMPRIRLWPYGYKQYFKMGGKQRWVEKAK